MSELPAIQVVQGVDQESQKPAAIQRSSGLLKIELFLTVDQQ